MGRGVAAKDTEVLMLKWGGGGSLRDLSKTS